VIGTVLSVAALALPAAATVVHAQSATVAASATVVTPLTVTGAAPLAFGVVFQGVAKTITFNNASSGRMSVSGFGTSQVALTFTLPTTLSNGASTMPINQFRVRVNATNTPAGATRIFLTSGVPVNRNLAAGALYFFIGGRVQPTAAQAGGSYSAPIVLTAAYTGL
jgi:hypothetical protein